MPPLTQLAEFLDSTLETTRIPDYANAVNGVQLSNIGDIQRVATAVDFSTETVSGTINAGARLLIVHHGMFWGGVQPIIGYRHQQLWALVTHDVAVYSAHLPLDVHPALGNNALLAKRLGLNPSGGFARYQTIDVGRTGTCDIPTRVIAERASALSAEYRGSCVSTPFESDRVTRAWGVCTGAGADSSTLREAASLGLDTLIVGEGPHHTAIEARELGIVVMYAGHYATETLGVRALGEALAERYGLTSTFIDVPSGL
ncbi:MAG TPA: Nif3-like dinuclear metal center hexameric protein [Gemmatimonadaceae bacterium]|nr:Nif3-like dinuclear metal center hexameric protein [Gemmatimonadaceae bacterium]